MSYRRPIIIVVNIIKFSIIGVVSRLYISPKRRVTDASKAGVPPSRDRGPETRAHEIFGYIAIFLQKSDNVFRHYIY